MATRKRKTSRRKSSRKGKSKRSSNRSMKMGGAVWGLAGLAAGMLLTKAMGSSSETPAGT